MSRITKALKKAQMDSIPHRRRELFKRLSENLLVGLPKPYKLSFLYSDEDPSYRKFIGRFVQHISDASLVTDKEEAYKEYEIECAEKGAQGNLILDNMEQEGSRIVFLVNRTDFYMYQTFPPERVLGAILIR